MKQSAADASVRTADEILAAFDTAPDGLTNAEALRRQGSVGRNQLEQAESRHPLRIFAAQFTDFLVLVLIGAAVIATFVGELEDTIAIVAIVILNAILGFVQEFRAERAIAALQKLGAPSAAVMRGGARQTIDAADVVPGDIVFLEAGNIVPADLRLLDANGCSIDESLLTGESAPVTKTTAPLGEGEAIGDRTNVAYKGTTVTMGRARGVAVAIGMQTELGRIATMLRAEETTATPLQRRLARFSKRLAVLVVVLCAAIFAAGLLRGEDAALMFMTALSLAVAAIPESLPAVVTVSLALGARRMARRNALVRRLPAVETLGSVTFICSDKTGTLTENRMRVDDLQVPVDVRDRQSDRQQLLLRAVVLVNDAFPSDDGFTGDPTETALLDAARSRGLDIDKVRTGAPRVDEVPFSSDRSMMSTLHHSGDSWQLFVKGAPERVLPRCIRVYGTGNAIDVDELQRNADDMASRGLRVLAVAMRSFDRQPEHAGDVEDELELLGFVGLLDPPRAEAQNAVALCQSAGIHVVMITGDHPATARAIAERLGIIPDNDESTGVVSGRALSACDESGIRDLVRHQRVYARVAPEDKIRIVRALQDNGEFVAMTGDGVNDAPALRRADIGVAMGKAGTDVAREASHMILLDDNFATIVNAVREGRRIYDNIRRFVRYALSTNSGEIWTLSLAPFLGLPLPLLPIHILWMNLVTDGLPGIALAAERAETDVMERPPRHPDESIFAHGLWQHAIWVGLLMAALALGTQYWSIAHDDSHWQTMVFTVLTLSQLAHVLAIRSERVSLFRQGLFSNMPLVYALLVTFALQLATLYVPLFNRVFHTVPLSFADLATCVVIASVIFFAVELEKLIRRRSSPSRTRTGSGTTTATATATPRVP